MSALRAGMTLALTTALVAVCGRAAEAAPRKSAGVASADSGFVVQLPPSGWQRRDDTGCAAAAGLREEDGTLTAWSDASGVLFWQIPLLDQAPYAIRGTPGWLRRCDRPPAGLWHELRDADTAGRIHLPDAARMPLLSWRWRLREAVGDSADGSRVSLGVTLMKRGTSQVREIFYVWSRTEEPETIEVSERTLIPVLLQLKVARIIVRRSPVDDMWVTEERDLRGDMARAFRGEAAGRILRIVVKLYDEPHRRRGEVDLSDLRFQPSAAQQR